MYGSQESVGASQSKTFPFIILGNGNERNKFNFLDFSTQMQPKFLCQNIEWKLTHTLIIVKERKGR